MNTGTVWALALVIVIAVPSLVYLTASAIETTDPPPQIGKTLVTPGE